MRILLDESVPSPVAGAFLPHQAVTVDAAGLKGLKNGELLTRAQKSFDAFFTVDKGIYYQHRHGRFTLRIVCLRCHRNTVAAIEPLVPRVTDALQSMKPGEVRLIDGRGGIE